MRRFSQSKGNKTVFRRALLLALPVLVFAVVFLLSRISHRAAWAADESAIEILKDVELVGVADGKRVSVGELAKGRPFFLVFSTAT